MFFWKAANKVLQSSSVFNSSLSRFEGWQQISGAAMKAKSSAKHADDATVGVLNRGLGLVYL